MMFVLSESNVEILADIFQILEGFVVVMISILWSFWKLFRTRLGCCVNKSVPVNLTLGHGQGIESSLVVKNTGRYSSRDKTMAKVSTDKGERIVCIPSLPMDTEYLLLAGHVCTTSSKVVGGEFTFHYSKFEFDVDFLDSKEIKVEIKEPWKLSKTWTFQISDFK